MLVDNGIECNASRTNYSINNKFIPIGDSGIDLFGNYKSMNYIIQLKYKSVGNVTPGEIDRFNQTLSKQPNEVQGFFVTTNGYSKRARNSVINMKSKMILCTDKDLLDNFYNEFKKNEQKQRNSLINEYRIENVKLDGTNDLDLFGIKFKGKCEIGSINFKRFNPY